jgi:hypothetical protein
LAAGRYLWHKTAVPVFLERFVLPVFAAAVILMAITNPMGFDITQRATGGLAVIFAAYFVAHSVYKYAHPAPQPDFAVIQAVSFIACDANPYKSILWAVYGDDHGGVVTPINCLILFQIATRDKLVSLASFTVEIPTSKGWITFPRIPLGSVELYGGPQNKTKKITLDHPEISSFLHEDIQPWKTILGYAAFNDPADPIQRDKDGVIVRIKATDALGRVITTEIKPTSQTDPWASGSINFAVPGPLVDLTGRRMERYYGQ